MVLTSKDGADGYFEKERVNGKSQTEITLSGSFLMKICKQIKNRDGKRKKNRL